MRAGRKGLLAESVLCARVSPFLSSLLVCALRPSGALAVLGFVRESLPFSTKTLSGPKREGGLFGGLRSVSLPVVACCLFLSFLSEDVTAGEDRQLRFD